MSPYLIIFRIAAALALILFFLMTYEPARCQTQRSTPSVQQRGTNYPKASQHGPPPIPRPSSFPLQASDPAHPAALP
jgi:hypothetical protein